MENNQNTYPSRNTVIPLLNTPDEQSNQEHQGRRPRTQEERRAEWEARRDKRPAGSRGGARIVMGRVWL